MSMTIGHNDGLAMDAGLSYRTHCWKAARTTTSPSLPIEVVRLRVRGARPLGLGYKSCASVRGTFRAPHALAGFIAPKGSVTLNGTSLTVNDVDGTDFGVNFIPHTQTVTTWGSVAVGDMCNLEIDTMARYVARLREWGP
jgi:hypothetical protein